MFLKRVASLHPFPSMCLIRGDRAHTGRGKTRGLGRGDSDGFYALTGGTAGALIGLIFVVITLGMEHAKEGDTVRTRPFVTSVLVYFASLLITWLAMIPPCLT
jgi:hypothetical protein